MRKRGRDRHLTIVPPPPLPPEEPEVIVINVACCQPVVVIDAGGISVVHEEPDHYPDSDGIRRELNQLLRKE